MELFQTQWYKFTLKIQWSHVMPMMRPACFTLRCGMESYSSWAAIHAWRPFWCTVIWHSFYLSFISVLWAAHYFINVPDTSANNAREENYWVFSTTCEILTTSWFLFSALVCYLVASCHINMYVWQTGVFLRWSTWLRSEIQGDTEPQRLVLR